LYPGEFFACEKEAKPQSFYGCEAANINKAGELILESRGCNPLKPKAILLFVFGESTRKGLRGQSPNKLLMRSILYSNGWHG